MLAVKGKLWSVSGSLVSGLIFIEGRVFCKLPVYLREAKADLPSINS
jgi:hypothetical protein